MERRWRLHRLRRVNEPLAHSAHDGAPEQSYRAHVGEVIRLAMEFGQSAVFFSPKWRNPFLAALEMAANYHDLGKLDEIFQDDLLKPSSDAPQPCRCWCGALAQRQAR